VSFFAPGNTNGASSKARELGEQRGPVAGRWDLLDIGLRADPNA
jgi:hypothetical protein